MMDQSRDTGISEFGQGLHVCHKVSNSCLSYAASEQRFGSFIKNLPIGVHIYGLDETHQLRFVDSNAAADKILGMDSRQYLGLTIDEAFPDLTKTALPQQCREIAERGQIWADEPVFYQGDVIRGAFAVYLFQTCPGEMAALFMDITESKKAEAALRASEERFRMMYEYAPILIDSFDEQGRCLLWNKECEKTFGWTRQEMAAHHEPLALLYPEPEIRRQVYEAATSEPDIAFREYRPMAKDGLERVTLEANFRLPDGMIINLGYDITDQRNQEREIRSCREQLRALSYSLICTEVRERERLALRLHDDISQRLAMIKLSLQVAMASVSESQMLGSVIDVCEKIDTIIDDAHLLIYELDNPVLKELGLEQALEKELQDIRDQFGITYVLSCEKELRMIDPSIGGCLFRSMRELFANTVKYARASTMNVSLRRFRDCIRAVVEDDGVGFTGQKRGFGLFSLQAQVENLGGDVEIQTGPHRGTKVVLTLPLPRETGMPEEKGAAV